jgi:hypothetical protein
MTRWRPRRSKITVACNRLFLEGFSRIEPDERDTRPAPSPPVACNHWGALCSCVHRDAQEACPRHTRPIALARLRTIPTPCSGVDQRLVREHSLDHLRHEACARARLLVTVADARGRSDDADPSLCQRVSMTGTVLHPARQALIPRGVVASHRPLSQVFALDADPRGPPPRASSGAVDDAPGDIKAVCARLWEVVS